MSQTQKKKGNIEAVFPLSPMQEGILFHTLYAPESGVYVDQYSCELEGDLDVEQFKRAWGTAVHRHAALRALFTWERREKALQIIRQRVELPWQEEDWTALSPDEERRRLDLFLEADRKQGFRLDHAPLMRFALFQVDQERHRLVWSFHHILLDGWSMRLVLNDVFRYYAAQRLGQEATLPPPPRFWEYISWLDRQDLSAAEDFWTRRLAGATATPLHIEREGAHSKWAESHGEQELRIPAASTGALRSFAREHRLTLNTVVRGAWALLLSRYSGESDVVFGGTALGRSTDLDGGQDMVGLFINTLPVRVLLRRDDVVVEWLQKIQRQQIEASAFEFAPLVSVQGWSGAPQGQPLFNSIVVFENHPVSAAESPIPDLLLRNARYVEQSNFPLALLAVPDEELQLILVYDNQRFEAETARRVLGHLETVLKAMTERSVSHLGKIQVLPDSELQQVAVEWSKNEEDEPAGECIHELIERATRENPDAVAVSFNGQQISYRSLDEHANRVARRLRTLGVRPDTPVAIALDRSLEMIVGILGVLKSGGAYVPLDPLQPRDRLRFVLQDTGAAALLTTRRFVDAVASEGPNVLCLDAVEDDDGDTGNIRGDDDQSSSVGVAPDNLAYVIYTSASTGKPKGVEVTHRNLAHSTRARLNYYPTLAARFLLLSPFVFDSSVAGIFWTLCQGSTLVLPEGQLEQDVRELARLIEAECVTHMLGLPTLHRLLLEYAGPGQLQSLDTVIVAGEACPRELAASHFEALPTADLYNEYGPTEATVWSTVHKIEAPDPPANADLGSIPISRPVENTEVYILDSHLQPTPIDVPGELFIGGRGLARGYLNQPRLTAEQFIVHNVTGLGETRLYRTGDLALWRPNGEIDFLGCVDRQVKIRGQRIEPEEIETVLQEHPAVSDAAVVLRGKEQPVVRDDDTEALVAHVDSLDANVALRLVSSVEDLSDDEVDRLVDRGLELL